MKKEVIFLKENFRNDTLKQIIPKIITGESVSFNQIQTINCPNGNVSICGTYTKPIPGNFNVSFSLLVIGHTPLTVSSVIDANVFFITDTEFCVTVPITAFGTNPNGNFNFQITANFISQVAPYDEFSAADYSANDSTGNDVFFGSCPIIANDDVVWFNQCSIGTFNVLDNDIKLGIQATTSNVTISQTSSSQVLALNTTTGQVTVAQNAAVGNYSLNYTICNINNNSQCDAGTINVTIVPKTLIAINDVYFFNSNYFINSCSGGQSPSVLVNDTICGIQANVTNVTTSIVSSFPAMPIGTYINNQGNIIFPPNSAPGSYTITYSICEIANPNNCTQTTAKVKVIATPIVANADNFVVNTLTGGTTPSAFLNDTYNGLGGFSSNSVTATIVSVTPLLIEQEILNNGFVLNANGTVFIPEGTPINVYTIQYQININGCSYTAATGTITINVEETIIQSGTLSPGLRADNTIRNVDVQSTGKIIINGYFTTYNNIGCKSIARLTNTLTFDTDSFVVTGPSPTSSDPNQPFNNTQLALDMKVIKNNGINKDKILVVGGPFTGFNGTPVNSNGTGIARLNKTDGSIDQTFNTEALANGVIRGVSGSNRQIRTLYVYPDNALNGNAGKIIIGGMFHFYNGKPSYKLARLDANGNLDIAFSNNINTIIDTAPIQASKGFSGSPQSIAVQQDGKIIVAGFFYWYNGKNIQGILRLHNDGSFDSNFNPYTNGTKGIKGSHIQKIVVQPNNQLIIGGFFSDYNGQARNNIARLTSNGLLDVTFNPGTGFAPVFLPGTSYGVEPKGMIRDMVLDDSDLANLKVYVSGNYTSFNNNV